MISRTMAAGCNAFIEAISEVTDSYYGGFFTAPPGTEKNQKITAF
jgi:hypothetical protein